MATIKFIHVLKRIEFLDANIRELRALESQLDPSRPYYDSMKIAIEQQVNNLLNERVKLMELKIENPLPHLVENTVTHQMQLKQSPMFDLDDLKRRRSAGAQPVDSRKTLPVKELSELPPEKTAEKRRGSARANLLRDLPQVEY